MIYDCVFFPISIPFQSVFFGPILSSLCQGLLGAFVIKMIGLVTWLPRVALEPDTFSYR